MGAIGGGLGGAVGVAAETAYGTFATLFRTVEPRSAKFQERLHITQGTGLAKGRTVDLGSRRVNTWSDAGGDLETEVLSTGSALMIAMAMGSTATLSAISATTAYSATFNYGCPDNTLYFCLQSLVPEAEGTLLAQSLHGGKITKAEWSLERAGLLMATYTCDFQQIETATSAFTPSEVTNSFAFSGVGMSFFAGTKGSEAALDGVTKFSCSVERMLDTERIFMGSTFKKEPLTKDVTKITYSIDVQLLASNKATVWDIYHSQTPLSLIMTCVGPAIGGSGSNNTIAFGLDNAYEDTGGTPELDGPDITKATMNFTQLIDAGNDAPFYISLITGDAAF